VGSVPKALSKQETTQRLEDESIPMERTLEDLSAAAAESSVQDQRDEVQNRNQASHRGPPRT
jgi:hypothetical protein